MKTTRMKFFADGHIEELITEEPAAEREGEEREPWRDDYERDVLRAVDENHIWLNAFSCVRPTDDFALRVGREVLRLLNDERCTHQSRSGYVLNLPSQRELVLRINKS